MSVRHQDVLHHLLHLSLALPLAGGRGNSHVYVVPTSLHCTSLLSSALHPPVVLPPVDELLHAALDEAGHPAGLAAVAHEADGCGLGGGEESHQEQQTSGLHHRGQQWSLH